MDSLSPWKNKRVMITLVVIGGVAGAALGFELFSHDFPAYRRVALGALTGAGSVILVLGGRLYTP